MNISFRSYKALYMIVTSKTKFDNIDLIHLAPVIIICNYQHYFYCERLPWTAKRNLNFKHTLAFYPLNIWSPPKGHTYLKKTCTF